MITAPWEARAETAIAAPLRHTWSVTATHPSWAGPLVLDVDPDQAATLTWDEAWSPHVQGSIGMRIPDQATLDLLDSRRGVRVHLSAGFVYPGGQEDVHLLASLLLHERTATRPDNRLSLTVQGRELLVQQWAPIFYLSDDSELYFPAAEASVAVITALLSLADPGEPVTVDPAVSRAASGTDVVIPEGGPVWSTITDQADRIDAWVRHDALTGWQISPRPTVAALSMAQLTIGPAGTITESTASLTRDEWANAVVLQGRQADGTVLRSYAIASAGPLSVAEAPRKVLTVTRDGIYPTAVAAAAILRRAISRGRALAVTALDAPWLRPGHTVTVQLPTGPQERHLVARVSRDLPAGLMTVTTRLPDDVTIRSGE